MQPYSFQDWLDHKFVKDVVLENTPVLNDSQQYLYLNREVLSYGVLNEIQDQQQQAYNYMMVCTVNSFKRKYESEAHLSADRINYLKIKIAEVKKYFQENESIYKDVIKPRLHRTIKIGATFIVPEQWLQFKNKKHLDAFIPTKTNYSTLINNKLTSFPTNEQMSWARMEVNVLWLKELENYLNISIKIKEGFLLDLKDNNEEFDQRVENYVKRMEVATTLLTDEEFIATETNHFLQSYTKPFTVVVHGASGPIQTFSVSHYAVKTFDHLSLGHNLPVKRLIDQARAEAVQWNTLAQKEGGRARTSADYSLDLMVFGYIKTGVAFLMYKKFLREQVKTAPKDPGQITINIQGDGNQVNTGDNSNLNAQISINK